MNKYGTSFVYKCDKCNEEVILPVPIEENEDLEKTADSDTCEHEFKLVPGELKTE
jgi:hypothetical protein